MIDALRDAGFRLEVTKPTITKDGIEHTTLDLIVEAALYLLGISFCSERQQCDLSHEALDSLAHKGEVSLWQSANGRVIGLTKLGLPSSFEVMMGRVIESEVR